MTEHKSPFDVDGKVVVVTGGSRGIGFGIAEGFVRAGARVYLCSRKTDECARAAEQLRQYGECHAITANLASVDGVRVFAAQVAALESKVDVLVNNAGNIWVEKLADYPESGWDRVFDLNVKSVFFLVQALRPLLEASGRPDDPARVINIGSIAGFHVPKHDTYAYSASKAAVHHLSRHLALALAPSHITVNVIAPGRFRSDILENAIELEGAEKLLAPIPLRKFAEGPDIAGAALYFGSAAGRYVTGVILPVDGGYATTL